MSCLIFLWVCEGKEDPTLSHTTSGDIGIIVITIPVTRPVESHTGIAAQVIDTDSADCKTGVPPSPTLVRMMIITRDAAPTLGCANFCDAVDMIQGAGDVLL